MMFAGVATDSHICLEPLALGELVAREGVEGEIGDEWVGDEGQFQERRHRRFEEGCCRAVRRAEHAACSYEQDEQRKDEWCDHVEGERGDVAAHVEALEYTAHAIDAKGHANCEDAEHLPHLRWHLDLIDFAHLGRDHVCEHIGSMHGDSAVYSQRRGCRHGKGFVIRCYVAATHRSQ